MGVCRLGEGRERQLLLTEFSKLMHFSVDFEKYNKNEFFSSDLK